MENTTYNKQRYNTATMINLKPLSRSQRRWLDLAVRSAESSECEQQHGAIIVKSGSPLAIGVNKWRNRDTMIDSNHKNDTSNNVSIYNEISIHAEMDALSRVKNPRGATIYIARVNAHGDERMSAPCYDCAEALRSAGIHKVVYTTS